MVKQKAKYLRLLFAKDMPKLRIENSTQYRGTWRKFKKSHHLFK